MGRFPASVHTYINLAGFMARNQVGYFILEKGAHVYAGRKGIYLEAGSIIDNLLTHTTFKHVVLHLE